jgi:nucleotide-binding universal stress UspA family protein
MELPKRILVPTDFSAQADSALDYAVDLAAKLHAHITIMHSYEIPMIGFPDGALAATADLTGRILTAAQDALQACVEARKNRGVQLSSLLRNGDPRQMINAVAQDIHADLIVMGTHGRRGISHALLGSVAESIVRTAKCPVLTVRGAEKAEARGAST